MPSLKRREFHLLSLSTKTLLCESGNFVLLRTFLSVCVMLDCCRVQHITIYRVTLGDWPGGLPSGELVVIVIGPPCARTGSPEAKMREGATPPYPKC